MDFINFLVIGDHKAGTTSIYNYLGQHPEIYVPQKRKELRFFAYDDENPYHQVAKSYPVKTEKQYKHFFPSEVTAKAKAIGEVSPNYLRSPVAAKNIHSMVPNAKLIVSLRNPADRLISAYLMRYRAGRTKKTLAEELFGEDAGRIKMEFYWEDLIRFYELFDRKQLKVILFDDIQTDPGSVMLDLFRFLNVNEKFLPTTFEIHNKGGLPRNQTIHTLLVKSKNILKQITSSSEVFSPVLKRTWKKIKRSSLTKIDVDEQIRNKILEVCHPDIIRTQDLIGRDLSCWLKQGEGNGVRHIVTGTPLK